MRPPPKGLRPVLVAVLAAGVGAFVLLGGLRYVSFDRLVSEKDALIEWADAHAVLAPAAFLAAYLVLGIFALPGSTVLNLSAGLLFDFGTGLMLVVAGSAAASSAAFLLFRFLFRGFVEAKIRRKFPSAFDRLEREGLFFVFALRLLPVIPFSAANLVLAVSPVRFWSCLAISVLALLPRHLLYVFTGSHLGDVQTLRDLLSPSLMGALAALAVAPWLTHVLLARLRRGASPPVGGPRARG